MTKKGGAFATYRARDRPCDLNTSALCVALISVGAGNGVGVKEPGRKHRNKCRATPILTRNGRDTVVGITSRSLEIVGDRNQRADAWPRGRE